MALATELKNYSKNIFVQRLGLVSISKIIVMLSSILLLPILTKTLPTSEYAIWVQILVFLGMLLPIAELGLTTAMLRFFPGENDKEELRDKFHTIFIFILTTSILVSLLPLLSSQQVSNYLFGGRVEVVYFIPLIFPIVVLNNLCMSYFRARQQIKKLSTFTVLQSILVMGLVALSILSNPTIFQALSAYGIAQIIMFWMMFAIIIKEIGISIPTLKWLKQYLVFGLPVLPQTIATWAIVGSDKFLIGLFIGITYVGYYAPAYGLGSSVMLFMAPLGTLLPSALSELHDTGRELEMWKRVQHSLYAFLALSIPTGIVISIFAKNILELLTTPEIAVNSYKIVPIIALASIIYGGQAIISNVLIVKKKMMVLTWITIISAIVCVGINLILIPKFGLLGAATALYITYLIQFGLTTQQAFKTYRNRKQVQS